ncbi:hypothetical protein Tco_1162000 [Tanacetum coccineum]
MPVPIVNFQIHRKGRNGYYEIMRADRSAKTYLLFSQLLKEFDREDLENIWKLVKEKHGNTRPEEGYERVLWGDLKTMFKHHIEDEVWRSLQGKKGRIDRIKSFIRLFGITDALIKVSAAQEERLIQANQDLFYWDQQVVSELMRMEQYLQCIDYTLWKIIKNGNAPIVTKTVDGKEAVIPPTSVEEKAQKRAELKERSTLLMALPNEH